MHTRLLPALLLAATTPLLASAQSNISFELQADPALNSGYGPVVSGDFNGDGKLDLISQQGPLVLQLGNGDGSFQSPVPVATFAVNESLADLITADVNGDGKLDLIATSYSGPVEVFFGNGNGTFQQSVSVSTPQQAASAVAFNANGDRYLDLAIGDSAGNVEIFTNEDGKSFQLTQTISLNSIGPVVRVRAGDMDGNGIMALAALTYSQAFVLWGDGHADFTAASLATYDNPADLNVADLNQNGKADILVSYHCGGTNPIGSRNPYKPCAGIDVFSSHGNQTTAQTHALEDPALYPAQPLAVDVDGDGIDDLVMGTFDKNSQSGLFVYPGHPEGSFDQTSQRYIVSTNGSDGTFVYGDFNRDGMMDFADGMGERYINASRLGGCNLSQVDSTVLVCQPVDGAYVSGPVELQANAFSTAHITALQEYVDSKLTTTQNVSSFNLTLPLSLGTHTLVTKAWKSDGTNFRSNRTITVYSGTPGAVCPTAPGTASICLPPTAPGASVHIVANGSTLYVPTAAQLYVDGSLVMNNRGYCFPNGYCQGGTSALDTYQRLSSGSHNLTFKVYDAQGNVYSAKTTVAVQ